MRLCCIEFRSFLMSLALNYFETFQDTVATLFLFPRAWNHWKRPVVEGFYCTNSYWRRLNHKLISNNTRPNWARPVCKKFDPGLPSNARSLNVRVSFNIRSCTRCVPMSCDVKTVWVWGGTLGISGWGCAAGTLEPLTFPRASWAEFCYPILE